MGSSGPFRRGGSWYVVRMDAPALVGLIGTLAGVLLGAALTFVFGRRNAISQRMHESRIDAYKSFASAAMDLRRALMNRWFLERGEPGTVGDDVYPIRSSAWSAYYAVELVSQKREIADKALHALDLIAALKDAPDQAALSVQAEQCRSAVSVFVNAARDDIAAKTRVI